MKIRLLVLDEQTALDVVGIHYGIPEHNIYKPVKIQVFTSDEMDWGLPQWVDIPVVFESELK